MNNVQTISDKNLYKLCKRWGAEALHARRKFAGLLPEVLKRRLFERRGFSSIYEFAAKLAGMSRDQVDLVLRLEKNLSDKPVLHEALIEGKISANKLIRIASIATVENQESLFDAANRLSKQAIDVFVKDFKSRHEGTGDIQQSAAEDLQQKLIMGKRNDLQNQKGLNKPPNEPKTLPGQTLTSKSFDFEIIAAMSPELKQKIKELLDKGHDIDKILLDLLKMREQNIAQEKEKISAKYAQQKEERAIIGMPTSHHIPVKTLRIIHQEYGSICSREKCNNIAHNIHHEQHFAKFHSHDPHFLKPLCKGHHELEHILGEP